MKSRFQQASSEEKSSMTAEEQEVSSNSEDPFCRFATKNPTCPYVTLINECATKITRIDKTLVGDDMMGGLVNIVKELQATIQKQNAVARSWINNLKPLAYIAAGSIITLVISHIHA